MILIVYLLLIGVLWLFVFELAFILDGAPLLPLPLLLLVLQADELLLGAAGREVLGLRLKYN